MSKPSALIALLSELEPDGSIKLASGAHLKVLLEDGPTITLEGDDIAKVLASEDTVREFFEACGSPAEASVELSGVVAPDSVIYLEDLFAYVEEI